VFVLPALVLALAVEVFAFIEVGQAIGWLLAVLLLLGTSLIGTQILRIQGRAAIAGVSRAVAERRGPGPAALDGALGFIGGVLLVVPGFVTDALGALLVFGPTRALARRWTSHHYAGRMMSFAGATARFAPGGRAGRPADVDSTAIDDDLGRLGR
jgi:UPF0716 protein FxsA